jgi:hypothetical protein
MPGLHAGTKALPLVEPEVSQEVGLFWVEGETVMPMAGVVVDIATALNKSGDLRSLLGERPATVSAGASGAMEKATSLIA